MNEAVAAMIEDQASITNRYGRYNVEKLDVVIDTVNTIHQRQTEMEALFSRNEITISSQSIRVRCWMPCHSTLIYNCI